MSSCWKCGRALPEGAVECEDGCQGAAGEQPITAIEAAMRLALLTLEAGRTAYRAEVFIDGHKLIVEVRKTS